MGWFTELIWPTRYGVVLDAPGTDWDPTQHQAVLIPGSILVQGDNDEWSLVGDSDEWSLLGSGDNAAPHCVVSFLLGQCADEARRGWGYLHTNGDDWGTQAEPDRDALRCVVLGAVQLCTVTRDCVVLVCVPLLDFARVNSGKEFSWEPLALTIDLEQINS